MEMLIKKENLRFSEYLAPHDRRGYSPLYYRGLLIVTANIFTLCLDKTRIFPNILNSRRGIERRLPREWRGNSPL